MKEKQFTNLSAICDLVEGDIVQGKSSGESYIVTAVFGNRATVVRTLEVTNPSEWRVLREVKE